MPGQIDGRRSGNAPGAPNRVHQQRGLRAGAQGLAAVRRDKDGHQLGLRNVKAIVPALQQTEVKDEPRPRGEVAPGFDAVALREPPLSQDLPVWILNK